MLISPSARLLMMVLSNSLQPGLPHFHGLVFSIRDNAMTGRSVACIHSVIRENHTALRKLLLQDLQLTSSGYTQLVPAAITCYELERLSIGSVSCQDFKTNVLIALTVRAYCKSLTGPRYSPDDI